MIKKFIGALALTMLFAAQAQAASMTIAGPSMVMVGDTITLQIFGDFDPDGLIAGGITFNWDASLVQLDSITRSFGLNDFSCPGSMNCPPDTANSAPIVWGEFLSDLVAPGEGEVLMATLEFTALLAGDAVFTMVDNLDLTGGWFGSGFTPIDSPAFGDASVQIVPLPAAVWFMIGGLGTLLGFRRK